MAYIQDLRAKVGHMPLILTSAAGALLNGHQVLLQERADTGNWGFPGGYSEYGETLAQTAQREFKEDAGIIVTPLKLLKIFDNDFYTYPNGDQCQPMTALYLVKRINDQRLLPKQSETVQTRWFDVDRPPAFFNQQHQKMMVVVQQYVNQLQLNR